MSLANDPYSFKLSLRGSTKLILSLRNAERTSVNALVFFIGEDYSRIRGMRTKGWQVRTAKPS
ncbi:MAG TPA: hypothetical protein VJ896_08165 [Bacteroidales bacterium]|nr:hypothetical protein [Bacteroidales bacterium]